MTQFRIVDTETTGPTSTPPDVACEVASVDYNYDPATRTGQPMAPRTELVQIGIPMPPDAQGIHHISDAELDKARDISNVFKAVVSPYPYPNIILVAHNCEYEQRVLAERLDGAVPWICTYKAALRLWPDAPNHKNQTLRYFLKLDIPEKLRGGAPHRALPDAIVSLYVLIECLKLATVEELIAWTKEPRLLPTCPIGKKQGWAGKPWCEVEPSGSNPGGFLRWMLDQPDMEADLKWNAKRELDRREVAKHTIGRDAYMAVIPQVIAMAKNLADLRQWFADEKPSREAVGIKEGTEQYAEIVRLCGEQKTKLAPITAAEQPDLAAPDEPDIEAPNPDELPDDDELTQAAPPPPPRTELPLAS